MKIGIANDIHLDHIKYIKLAAEDMSSGLDALVLCGDLSVGKSLGSDLKIFIDSASCPVYFVLGNHDFWGASTSSVWETAKSFPGSLDHSGVVKLSDTVGLVGVTGWYDSRAGSVIDNSIIMPEIRTTDLYAGVKTTVCINPWEELEHRKRYSHIRSPEVMVEISRINKNFADEQTLMFKPRFEAAMATYDHVIVATHFPPWLDACWGPGGVLTRNSHKADLDWLPWSCNINLGLYIESVAEEYPSKKVTVLSGHTHSGGTAQIAPNLTAMSGDATYGMPRVDYTLDV